MHEWTDQGQRTKGERIIGVKRKVRTTVLEGRDK